jgi:hypothetical protein
MENLWLVVVLTETWTGHLRNRKQKQVSFSQLAGCLHYNLLGETLQYDNDNDKPIESLLKGKGLLPPVGLARLDS